MEKCDIGVIGLAVMGQNLALNMHNKCFRTAVYNRTAERTRAFIEQRGDGLYGAESLEEFVSALARPRKVLLLVKAGPAVDATLDALIPLLEPGDIVMESGNSHFSDTDRRQPEVEKMGVHFIGMGVSGGEYGALHGPSIMPGGRREAYESVEPILTRIAAQTADGPCCAYLGSGSAGHFVKMVHNGIEYGVMQVLAEAYDVMRRGMGLSNDRIQAVFAEWNQGELASYLVEITADILSRTDDETGDPLVEAILDEAQQKGTGKWTSQAALDLGVPVPTLTAAVDARILSAMKAQRVRHAQRLSGPDPAGVPETLLGDLADAVYLAVLASYAQGMHVFQAASEEKGYGLDRSVIARIWKGGCIVRSALLDPIQKAYEAEPGLESLLLAPHFSAAYAQRIGGLRRIAEAACSRGLPVPALSASLAYLDGLRTERLPANLIQAQRDYFGAHTYRRVDREGDFHTEWQDIHNVI